MVFEWGGDRGREWGEAMMEEQAMELHDKRAWPSASCHGVGDGE